MSKLKKLKGSKTSKLGASTKLADRHSKHRNSNRSVLRYVKLQKSIRKCAGEFGTTANLQHANATASCEVPAQDGTIPGKRRGKNCLGRQDRHRRCLSCFL